ncbi:hypothetical protein L0P88_21725 [Muricauda sp. SCSIO 64092]|uniref:hypothetical protein n=1 Tax=Allomuricauda sp. SCSIO 64092 TaxID=2908842 RepID=UPI001FF2E789|nr:hypothetical protein [Muricauda sp. SCSIO 64092]UOY06530.1 hypothetical protein L0P88_21725 [Muricauda sp. SCSIO 64092]
MDKKQQNAPKTGLIIGVCGFIAGIFLIFSNQIIIGIAGSFASAGIAIKGYMDLKKLK